MAVLTKADVIGIWRDLYKVGEGKAEAKANGPLPSTNQLAGIYQVFEDLWENSRTKVKGQLNSAFGRNITPQLAKKLGKSWLRWKLGRE